jgi:hypothetical protein
VVTAADRAFADIARELYALPPSEFTAARNARATGEHAAAIKALSKPSAAVWAINLLAANEPEELDHLAALGDAMRQAQADLDRTALSSLGSGRRQLVLAISKQAAELASEAGHPLSAAASLEIQDTLQAALSDPDAAAAVASGVLVRTLVSDGLGSVDLTDAVAAPTVRRKATKDDTAKRAQEAAQKAADEAQEEADSAAAELAAVEKQVAAARKRQETADEARDAAQRALDEAAEAASSAARELEEIEGERVAKRRERDRAARNAQRARDATI